jgi:hypothetical protein
MRPRKRGKGGEVADGLDEDEEEELPRPRRRRKFRKVQKRAIEEDEDE